MEKLAPFFLCFALVLSGHVGNALGKGGRGQAPGQAQGRGNNPSWSGAGQTHGNGQASLDRDFGKERAKEVGKGKKKGLYKDEYSIGEGREKEKQKEAGANGKVKSEKAKQQKEKHKDKD